MNWRRNLWSLWFGCFLSSSSYTMVVPFLPLYLFDLGVTSANVNMWSGLVFSATFFVGAVMAPYWGRKADKAGKRRMVIRSGFSLAAVYFLGAFVRNPVELFAVRVLQGLAAGFVPASFSIVASSAPEDKMGFSLGLMQTATLTGGIVGPLFGGVLSHIFGIRTSFIVAAVLIFGATIAVRLLVQEPASAQLSRAGSVWDDLKTAVRNHVLLEMLLLLMIVQIAAMILQPLITLYIAELQGHLEGAVLTSGFVFSLAGLAGAVAAPVWGRFGQQAGFVRILIIAFIGAGISIAGQYFATTVWQFGCVQFIFGLFIAGLYPAINTLVVTHTEPSFQGRAFGLTMSANQAGSMIGPLLGGAASAWVGIKMIFIYTGIFLIAAGLYQWAKSRKETSDEGED